MPDEVEAMIYTWENIHKMTPGISQWTLRRKGQELQELGVIFKTRYRKPGWKRARMVVATFPSDFRRYWMALGKKQYAAEKRKKW